MSYEDIYKNIQNLDWKAPDSLASLLRAEVFEHSSVGPISKVLE